jgi:hypothetical protein
MRLGWLHQVLYLTRLLALVVPHQLRSYLVPHALTLLQTQLCNVLQLLLDEPL